MAKLFAGFSFVFLDFNLTMGGHSLGLIPDFVGTILLLLGMQELAGESERYPKLRPWLYGVTVFSALVWLLDLLAIATNSWLFVVLNLADTVAVLYISYQVVMGFTDIEQNHAVNIEAGKTVAMWKICAVLQVTATLLSWVPVVNILLIIAQFVVVVMMLMALNTNRRLYNEKVRLTGAGTGNRNGPEF